MSEKNAYTQNCFLKLENEVLSHPIQLAGTLLSETQKTPW
jgi:hypothetical protein